MYLSLNWLKDFIDIPKKITIEELNNRLISHTVEIDNVLKQEDKFANIVVGKILEIKKHPNADKLQLTIVDIKSEKLNIVCGASNIKENQLVPVALIGAVMPNGLEIKKTEIRGVESFGMLCAEDELGLGDDHSGIMILDSQAKIGESFATFLKLKDTIFEIDNKSITNRPDLWGHYGMAREIACFLDIKLKKYNIKEEKGENIKKLNIKIENSKLCQRYVGAIIDNIKIQPSPKWIQERLIAVGINPINNIVDATNYVMLDIGQPMHAFDIKKISDNDNVKIIIRNANKDEKIISLDGEERELDDETLIIADNKNPIAIAGIIGGEESSITNETNSIVLESANFNFITIRKTSKKLNLRTESSQRFEKSLDPEMCKIALLRAISLIKETCPQAKIASNIVDEKKYKLEEKIIILDLNWLNKIIGVKIEEKKVIKILEKLGFKIAKINKTELEIKIPTWRSNKDISIKEDIVEEVARIYGYNNIELKYPKMELKTPIANNEKKFEKKIKNILSGAPALTEVYNYSFVGEKQLKKIGIDFSSHIKLSNSLNINHTLLRQSLIPNLIQNIKTNQAKFDYIKIFEIGNIFLSIDSDINKDKNSEDVLPYQEKKLGIIFAGEKIKDEFNKIKGVIEYLTKSFNLSIEFNPCEIVPSWASEKISAKIICNQILIGSINSIQKNIRQKNNIKKETVIAEISLKELFNLYIQHKEKKYIVSDKYPVVIRDLAFVLDNNILYNNIRNTIINFNKYIKTVELFDEYYGDKLGKNKKSLAFHIVYQADKTLTSEEIDKLQKELFQHLENKFEAKLRDF